MFLDEKNLWIIQLHDTPHYFWSVLYAQFSSDVRLDSNLSPNLHVSVHLLVAYKAFNTTFVCYTIQLMYLYTPQPLNFIDYYIYLQLAQDVELLPKATSDN